MKAAGNKKPGNENKARVNRMGYPMKNTLLTIFFMLMVVV